MIADNLQNIRQAIQESCALVSRNPQEVTMIGVTKTVDDQKAAALAELGVKDLAENRAEKLLEKKAALAAYPELRWHLIGNLQRRKVKTVINEIDYFHALDGLKLAAEINKRAAHIIKCFVEVNVSGEESKHGIKPAELVEFVECLAEYPNIEVVGLMTMAPFDADEDELHHVFSELKKLQVIVKNKGLSHAPCLELSMGMSNDFPIAVQEGATFIRIGTALFKDA